MKKWSLLFFLILTVLGFSATDKEAEEKIKKEMEKIMEYHKTGGRDEREKLLISNRLDRNSVSYFIMGKMGSIMLEGHKKSEYKINSIQVRGNEAEIDIDYKGPDLRQEAEKFQNDFEKKAETVEKIKQMSKKDSKKYIAQEFEKYMIKELKSGNVKYYTKKNLKLKVKKIGNWDNLNLDRDFLNILSLGIMDTFHSIAGL
ncbi:hypothetical protein EII29_01540 [Leptotrichia sp. OH3620_COT-345]|uniref:hypothetical protein n=1 Tax=Leptotrichia sp. OH3620_COT-345 TaxID=2491048 RepID=UPI000F64CC2F|nr:hypothetical protein [Leptotrichia sp. OH3620_COT-345]RRD40645.1 hypothetical protein EII29_01540 [Leptotrichia sp. OH3620_COT-345]